MNEPTPGGVTPAAEKKTGADLDGVDKKALTLASYYGLLVLGLTATIIGPTLPYMRATFGVSLGRAGTLFMLLPLAGGVTCVASGILSDIIGGKPFILFGTLLITLGLVAIYASPLWGLLIASFAVLGIGHGSVNQSWNNLTVSLHTSRRGAALNNLYIFFALGGILGPALTSFALGRGLSWREIYLGLALFNLVLLPLLRTRRFPSTLEHSRISRREVVRLLREPVMIYCILIAILYLGVEVGISGWIYTFLLEEVGFVSSRASLALSAFWFWLIVGRWLCGRVAQIMRDTTLQILLTVGLVATSWAGVAAANPTVSAFFLALTGLFCSGVLPGNMAIATGHIDRFSGTVTGVLIAAGSLGIIIFPKVIGVIGEHHSLRLGLYLCVLLSLVILILSILLHLRVVRRAERAVSRGSAEGV